MAQHRFCTLLLASILAVAALAPASVEQARARASGIDILSSSMYRSSTGSIHLVGEVANSTADTVSYVKIIASYYDAGGTLIASDFSYTEMDDLLPTETSPFDILTLDPPDGITRYELALEYDSAFRTPLRGIEWTVGSVRQSITGTLHIVGEVRNSSGQQAEFVKVIAALYDDQDAVIRVTFTFTSRDKIEDGGRSPFDLLILDPPQYKSYKLWVDGSPVD